MKNLYLCEFHDLSLLSQRGSPGINGGGVEEDHVLVGLEARESIGGKEVTIALDGGSLGCSHVEQYHEEHYVNNARRGSEDACYILDDVKASSDEHLQGRFRIENFFLTEPGARCLFPGNMMPFDRIYR